MDNGSNNNLKNKKLTKIALGLSLVLIATFSLTYAYFTGALTNIIAPSQSVITSGVMALEFSDGPEVTLENAIPGSYVEKTFKVKNTGNVNTTYDLYFSELINSFEDKTDLVYSLTTDDSTFNKSNVQVPDSNEKIVNLRTIVPNQEHTYTLRIDFKETNDNQDDNKGKQFSAKISVNEAKEAAVQISPSRLKVGDRVLYSTFGNEGTINSWIVIKEGSEPELVSETTSPNTFAINNANDWKNWVGILNTEASSYGMNKDVVKSARHMGYSNQVEWCESLDNCYSDTGYNNDVNLVNTAMGSLNANTPGSDYSLRYWLASRYVHEWSPTRKDYITVWVNDGSVSVISSSLSDECAVRPIITLKDDVILSGTGNNNEYRVVQTEQSGLMQLKIGDTVKYSVTGNEGLITDWVVIKEGTEPELVSKTTSPDSYELDGTNGYLQAVQLLNAEAASYGTNTNIVKSTRHFGYSYQVESCSSLSSCYTDSGYRVDSFLVKNAMNNSLAAGDYYWVPSRETSYSDYTEYNIKAINPSGNYTEFMLYNEDDSSDSYSNAIRPIITLKSNVNVEKTSNDNEWQIVTN